MAPCAPYPRLWSGSSGSEGVIIHRDFFSPIAGTHTQLFPSRLIVDYRCGHYPISFTCHAHAVSTGPANPHSRGTLLSPRLKHMRADAPPTRPLFLLR